MVSCTACVENGVECWYDRRQSVKCHECVSHPHRKCDGSFTLEEFRKVGELKKLEQRKRREKARQVSNLRKTLLVARRALADAQEALALAEGELVGAEEECSSLDETIAALDEKSERMLKRKIQVLSVFKSLPDKQEITLGEADIS